MESPTPAAGSIAAEPTPIAATDAAVVSGKTSDFREARRAERIGKPLPPVEAASDAPSDSADNLSAEPPKLSRRERAELDQQAANERVRKAVEAATADLRAEVERLKTPARPATAPAAAVEPPKGTPEYKRLMALPGAPKLADYDTVEEHAFAVSEFIDQTRHHERQSVERQRAEVESLTKSQIDRVEKFQTQLEASKQADPEFVNKLSAEVKALKPFGALHQGEQGGPLNVVAEQLFDSPIAPAVLLHLSQHPADLQALVAMPPEVAAIRDVTAQQRAHVRLIVSRFNRLEGRLEPSSATATSRPIPKTLSDAPEPAPVLGNRPREVTDAVTSAVKSGSTSAYREARRQERLAAQKGR